MPVAVDDRYTAPIGTAVVRFGNGIAAPQFTQQPTNATVTEPAQATFEAAVSGATSLQWQWTAPGGGAFSDIVGATSGVFTTAGTDDLLDSGRQVRLRASNASGETFSNVVTLTVMVAVQQAPSESIVQYLTHDGDAVGNVVTSSAPNRLYWNTVLEVPWSRGVLGDWRDSLGVANGSTPYASFPAVAAAGRRTLAVTPLVQRWRTNGLNRGFFLSSRINAFPLVFAGRAAANVGDRPELVVVTTTGTFNLAARANACWNSSSVSVVSSAAQWELRAGQQPAILQFDLSSVTGTVTSATLGVTLTTLTQTGAIIDVFEADPPVLFDPADMSSTPTLGIGANGWPAVQASGSVLLAKDFATGAEQINTGNWAQAITRTVDTARGTTYAQSFIATGTLAGADSRVDIVTSATSGGVTQSAQRRNALHATIRFKMSADFAGFADRVKIPAMGAQLGWWNTSSGGYWQPVTGNGGYPGTGLKVVNAEQGNRVEYHGHSSRLTTGYRASDVSAYGDYVRLAAYIYHLDQVGAFPTEDTIPGLLLKRGTWYDFSHFLQLNTMSGAQDGLGNYATANADGIYTLRINGHQVMTRTNYRWVRHPEFSVQGFWVDVYHGGTNPSDRNMTFAVNELAIATAYIGPVHIPVQLSGANWTPNRDDSDRILDTDWAQLPKGQIVEPVGAGDTIDEVIPNPRYEKFFNSADGSPSIVSAWSGAAVNRELQELYVTGGGHGDSHFCENGYYRVKVDTLKVDVLAQRSSLDATRWYNGTAWVNSRAGGDNGGYGPLKDSRAPAIHTYHGLVHVPASSVGNAGGKVLKFQHSMEQMDLPGAVFDTPYFNPTDPQIGSGGGGYLKMLVSWPYAALPYANFYIKIFKWDVRAHSWYSLNADGASLPNPQSAGAYIATPWPGGYGVPYAPTSNIPYRHACMADRTDLGKAWMIFYDQQISAVRGMRFDYAAWIADAVATGNWGNASNFQTRVELTGADAGVFNEFSLDSYTPGSQFSDCGMDYENGRLWVMGNMAGGGMYRISGVDGGSSWVVTAVSGASVSRSNVNSTYGRFRTFRRGLAGRQVTVGVRINSTTTPPEVVRLTDPGE